MKIKDELKRIENEYNKLQSELLRLNDRIKEVQLKLVQLKGVYEYLTQLEKEEEKK